MAIKLLTSLATAEKAYAPGEVITLSPVEEQRYIEKGLAEKAEPKKRGRPPKQSDQ